MKGRPMFDFSVLDDRAVREVHDTALEILETIGMEIAGEAPRRALLDAGAREKEGRILYPHDLIEKTLKQAPQQGFELVGRDGAHRVRAVPGVVHFRPAGGLPFLIEYPSLRRRPATLEDARVMVRVADACDGIHVVNSAVSPAELGVGVPNLRRFVNAIEHSTKPSDITASSPEEVRGVARIAEVVRGSREALDREPIALVYVSPTSPMRLSEPEALAVMECARANLPLAPLSCPTLAATAPVTLAGAVAQEWAEDLALMTLAYTVRPGLPVVACSRLFPVDMRRGITVFSGPAPGLGTAALTRVAASFRIPANGWGFSTASHAPDLQAGAERMMGALFAVLAGTNMVSGAGALDNALSSSPEQLVIDNELISLLGNAVRGVPVTADALAREFLADGIREGTFMASPHTLEHLRTGDVWFADLFSDEPYETWNRKAAPLLERAHARVGEILRTHEIPPIEPSARREIDVILRSAGA
ncbi:MAG: trimethylamine methyltransferase family protein [Planctomycetota bacterium]